jgi:hypothetical protein
MHLSVTVGVEQSEVGGIIAAAVNAVTDMVDVPTGFLRDFPHSIGFSGGVRHRSAKASRGEDLDIEEPIRGG